MAKYNLLYYFSFSFYFLAAKFLIQYEYEQNASEPIVDHGMESSPFGRLPGETIDKIFGYLNFEEKVENIPCVSKRFFEIVKMRVTLEDWKNHHFQEAFICCGRRFPDYYYEDGFDYIGHVLNQRHVP